MKQLKNTLQDLKCMLIEDGYKDDNIVMRTLIKAEQQIKNSNIQQVSNLLPVDFLQNEMIKAIKELANESTALDKDTSDWLESDIKRSANLWPMVADKRSLNTKINYMNEIENTIKKAQDEALNKLRLGTVSGSHYPMLLMASYCGYENPKCTDELPCKECLKMCNIVLIPKDQVKNENIISGYDFLNDCR